jgi:DNA-binding HxlR family transcriptional regulator
MRRKRTGEMDCSIARALDVVGEWWTLLIVRDLGLGDLHRFEQLQQNLGIARNVLTVRLQKLVEHGIVEMRPYQQRPERFEYHLTAKGRDLAQTLYALLAWGDRWTRDGAVVPAAARRVVSAAGRAKEPAPV